MSLDSAKAFIEKMTSDEIFRGQVLAIEDVAGQLAFITSEGFDCTDEEIRAVTGELSNEDLDKAAGGKLIEPGSCWGLGNSWGSCGGLFKEIKRER